MPDPETPNTDPLPPPDPIEREYVELRKAELRLEVLKLAVAHRPFNTNLMDFAHDCVDFVFDE